MRKYLLSLVFAMTCIAINAQTYTSGALSITINDSVSHDSTSCKVYRAMGYNIVVASSVIGDTVRIVDAIYGMPISTSVNTTGASPWSVAIIPGSLGSQSNYDYGVFSGYYQFGGPFIKVICGMDTIPYIDCSDSIAISNPCIWGTASGQIYFDHNSNCVYDAGDSAVVDPFVNVTENLSSPGIPTSNGPGNMNWGSSSASYSVAVQESWMINYSVHLDPLWAFIFPMSPCFAGPYTFTTLPQTGVDFPLQCTSNVDLQCAILSPARVRWGFPLLLHPWVNNTGCDTVSGQLTMIKDSRTIYDASLSTHPADMVSGDTLTWNFPALKNVTAGAYWNSFAAGVYLTTDATVTPGDTLCFSAYTGVPATDIDAANNSFHICIPVVYSYDPNVKEVSPAGTGPEGFIEGTDDTLTYTLHFQNTGSDYAYDVKIIDTLDSHTLPQSLRVLGASHKMEPEWLAPNVVQFTFNSIYLADSATNEPESHGAVSFKIALDHGLPAGTQIKNTGYIYFDLNPPVITNTVLNTLSSPTTITGVETPQAVAVYPNPATDRLTVEHLKNGSLYVLNMNGSVVLSRQVSSDKVSIDISRLPAGVYMLRTVNARSSNAIRFTKY